MKLSKLMALSMLLLANRTLAELLVDSPLNFGKIAITNNSSVSSLHLSRNGKMASTNAIYILKAGNPGVYTITGFSPYTMINLSSDVPSFSTSMLPGTEQLILRKVDMPARVQADMAGNAQFSIGGVIETTGVGGNYLGPANYQIDLTINISY